VDIIDNNIRVYLRRIGQRTKSLMDERLLPHNITSQQARIVGFINAEQEQGKVVCQKDIEKAFELKGSSITSLLQGLERKGFIVRHLDPSDERRKCVALLPKGLELVREFAAAFHELDEKMVRDLTLEQLETLAQALKLMAHNLEQ